MLVLISSLLAIAALNYVVNPFYLFDAPEIPGFNQFKPKYESHARIAKPSQIERQQPAHILFGSSRTDIGLDPATLLWGDAPKPIFNAAVNGANLATLAQMVEHSLITAEPQQITIGLDFFMFNAFNQGGHPNPEFLADLNGTTSTLSRRFYQDLFGLLSLKALSGTKSTLRHQDADDNKHWPNGHKNSDVEIGKGFSEGYSTHFDRYAESFTARQWTPCQNGRFLYERDNRINTLTRFENLLDTIHRHDAETLLIISPMHIRLLSALYEAGLWEQYMDWKRNLVAIVEAHNETTNDSIALWDFAVVSPYTIETIPADHTVPMQWFVDSSHYTEHLGNLMIAQTQNQPSDLPRPGYPMLSASLEAQLMQQETLLKQYISDHPEEMAEIRQLVNQGLTLRRMDDERCATLN